MLFNQLGSLPGVVIVLNIALFRRPNQAFLILVWPDRGLKHNVNGKLLLKGKYVDHLFDQTEKVWVPFFLSSALQSHLQLILFDGGLNRHSDACVQHKLVFIVHCNFDELFDFFDYKIFIPIDYDSVLFLLKSYERDNWTVFDNFLSWKPFAENCLCGFASLRFGNCNEPILTQFDKKLERRRTLVTVGKGR